MNVRNVYRRRSKPQGRRPEPREAFHVFPMFPAFLTYAMFPAFQMFLRTSTLLKNETREGYEILIW